MGGQLWAVPREATAKHMATLTLGLTPWGGVTQLRQQPLLASTVLWPAPHSPPTMIRQPRAWRSAPYLRCHIQPAPHSPYDGYLLALAVGYCATYSHLGTWSHRVLCLAPFLPHAVSQRSACTGLASSALARWGIKWELHDQAIHNQVFHWRGLWDPDKNVWAVRSKRYVTKLVQDMKCTNRAALL